MDKKQGVRYVRSDNQGSLLRMLLEDVETLSISMSCLCLLKQLTHTVQILGKKSEVIVFNVMMNEACGDMIEIMHCIQNYLGSEHPCKKRVL